MKNKDKSDIELLVCMYIDGDLSSEQVKELAAMISSDPDLAEQERLYRSLDKNLGDSLREQFTQDDFAQQRQEITALIERKVLLDGQVRRGKIAGLLHLPWLSIVSAAAAIAIIATGWMFWSTGDKPGHDRAVVTCELVRENISLEDRVVECSIRRPSLDEFAIDVDVDDSTDEIHFKFVYADSTAWRADIIGRSDSYRQLLQ